MPLKYFVPGMILLSAVLIVIVVKADTLSSAVGNWLNTINNSFTRLNPVFAETDLSANRHIDYYLKLPELFASFFFVHLIWGFGTISAGLPYARLFGFYSVQSQWNPESDLIIILVGNGIIGIYAYYKLIYSCLKNHKNNYKMRSLVVAIFVCGIMYTYIRTWVILILVFLSIPDTGNLRQTGENLQ